MMIFSNVARLLAIAGVVFGLFRILTGVVIATEYLLPYEQALARFAPGSSSSGQVIDKGIYTILAAIALGTLAEISFSIRKVLDKI